MQRRSRGKVSLAPVHWALLVSLTIHAALLTLRFVDPDRFNRVFQDMPLEVILVNARSAEPPTKAQAIAQANLSGGGNVERGRAQSPLPAHATAELGDAPGLRIVGVNLDDNAAEARQALRDTPYRWLQARIDEKERARVIETLELKRLPTVLLLDARGFILQRDLQGERLRTAVLKSLKS